MLALYSCSAIGKVFLFRALALYSCLVTVLAWYSCLVIVTVFLFNVLARHSCSWGPWKPCNSWNHSSPWISGGIAGYGVLGISICCWNLWSPWNLGIELGVSEPLTSLESLESLGPLGVSKSLVSWGSCLSAPWSL